jgi:hypothetical protein
MLFKEGHVHEAEKLQRETLATMIRVLGPEHPSTLLVQSSLAEMLIGRAATRKQKKTLGRLSKYGSYSGPAHPYTLIALQQLGTAMAHTHRYAEASKLFRDVIEKQDNSKGKETASRCGIRSPVWPRLPTIPMTRFSICVKPSIAGIKMPMD